MDLPFSIDTIFAPVSIEAEIVKSAEVEPIEMSAIIDQSFEDGESFLARVKELPVVNAGVGQVWSLYQRYLFNTVTSLNNMACSGLTMAEERYPSIMKDPEEIKQDYMKGVQSVKDIPGNMYASLPTLPRLQARAKMSSLRTTSRQRATDAARSLLAVLDYADSLVDGYVAAEEDVGAFNVIHHYASVSGNQKMGLITRKALRGVMHNSARRVYKLTDSVVMTIDDARRVLRNGVEGITTLPSTMYHISPDAFVLRGVQAWISLITAVSDKSMVLMPLADKGVTVANGYLHELSDDLTEADSITGYSMTKAKHYGAITVHSLIGLGAQGLESVNEYSSVKTQQLRSMGGRGVALTREAAHLALGMTILAMEQTARLPVLRDLIIRANEAIEKENKTQ